MKRLPMLTLVFAILSAVFFLLLIFFRIPFPLYPLMSWQDAIDHLTPLVLIPLYWLIFKSMIGKGSKRTGEVIFIVIASLWVLGHGMHLAANSINNLSEKLAAKGVVDILDTDIYTLTYFYDEKSSHYLWHLGIIGLAALIIFRTLRDPQEIKTNWWIAGIAGFFYGLTHFLVFIEGQTSLIGYPFAILMVLCILIWGRKKLATQPVLAFFLITYALAAALFTGWLIYWGSFVEPTEVLPFL